MTQLSKEIDLLNVAFNEFKSANDDRIAAIEKNGSADQLLEEKVNRANDDISKHHDEIKKIHDDATKRIDDLEIIVNRKGLGAANDPENEQAHKFYAMIANGEIDPKNVNVDEFLSYKKSLKAYLRRGKDAMPSNYANALSVGSDPDGGYWVEPDTTGRTTSLIYETSPMRQHASVQGIGTDALEGFHDLDESVTGWVGEMGARPETATPGIGKWRIPLHEQYAMPKVTQKVLDDTRFDVEGWLGDKTGMKMGRTENTSFFVGDGVDKPRGCMTYAAGTPSSSLWNVIQQVNSGSATLLTDDGLVDLVFALKSFYRQNAKFVMNRATVSAVRKLKQNGEYIWIPDYQERQGGRLLGYDVIEAEDLADVGAGTLPIIFGDMAQLYQIVDGPGIRVLRDPFTTKGFVKFYTTKRVGGDVINFEAALIQKIST